MVIIAQSFWRKVLVTIIAAAGFASLYEVTALDSKYVARLVAPSDSFRASGPG